MRRLSIAFAIIAATAVPSFSRDNGKFAGSPLKPWFDHLHSGRGPCCSDADGSVVQDADWESKDGHYRVRIPKVPYDTTDNPNFWVWVDVPDEAVITEPNQAGRTMVWPVYGAETPSIRCFLPGSMT